ncbi:hypothetical protein QJS10_CPB20g01292 [Acorus calamus]|uniref:Uncharacterized protein n=1 Tax=Acorus calamus TaxID=4465 RepID=A0AAV9CA18_ACOCL|nr:hypothetical protein QJS10_CPB20g01292 [Acorus calamus]
MDIAPSGKDSTKARELLIAISQSIPEKAVSFTPPPGNLTDGNIGFASDGGNAAEITCLSSSPYLAHRHRTRFPAQKISRTSQGVDPECKLQDIYTYLMGFDCFFLGYVCGLIVRT